MEREVLKGLPPSDVQVEVLSVSRQFGIVCAVDDVSLAIQRGQFVSILGPSGCGKTTLLRIIAGLERPDHGSVRINGVDITNAPPSKRPTNLVFQHGALFPHMTVFDNIAYGLKRKGWRGGQIKDRVEQLLALVQLTGYETRRPSQLSGGQARRVGLARALAPSPDVLLLDEPLSALDLKLRKEMQLELRRIHREVGTTFIYVTHDQEESLVMSDRIVVMRSGRVEQDATPRDIYANPSSAFVAGFIGETNLLQGLAIGTVDDTLVIQLDTNETIRAKGEGSGVELGSPCVVSIRPETVRIGAITSINPSTTNLLSGRVEEAIFLGDKVRIRAQSSNGTQLWTLAPFDSPSASLAVGDAIDLSWRVEDSRLLPSLEGQARSRR
jgi:spermidine/putrescine transport system ATP-binding protein